MVSSWSSSMRAAASDASRPVPEPPQTTATRKNGPSMRAQYCRSISASSFCFSASSFSCVTPNFSD